jgi:hypothetical protein
MPGAIDGLTLARMVRPSVMAAHEVPWDARRACTRGTLEALGSKKAMSRPSAESVGPSAVARGKDPAPDNAAAGSEKTPANAWRRPFNGAQCATLLQHRPRCLAERARATKRQRGKRLVS